MTCAQVSSLDMNTAYRRRRLTAAEHRWLGNVVLGFPGRESMESLEFFGRKKHLVNLWNLWNLLVFWDLFRVKIRFFF